MPSKSIADLEYESYAGETPDEADFVYDSDVATAGGACTSTLPAVANKRNYVLGFAVTATAPAALQMAVVTLTGLFGGNMSFQISESTSTGTQLIVNFAYPLPGPVNTAISINMPAVVAGGIPATAIWGFAK